MKILNLNEGEETINEVVRLLRRGEVVGIPTDTCFALAACAENMRGVKKVFKIKEREKRSPVAVFLSSLKEIPSIAKVNNETYRKIETLLNISGRFTFVLLSKGKSLPSPFIRCDGKVGIRVPHYEVPKKIVRELGDPITATSANKAGNPPIYNYRELKERLELRYIIQEELPKRETSTVLDLTIQPPKIVREGAVRRKELEGIIQFAP